MQGHHSASPAVDVRLSITDLQAIAAAAVNGLETLYLPGQGLRSLDPQTRAAEGLPDLGRHEVVHLGPDLMLSRSDMHTVPAWAHAQRWEFDFRGWCYLHFRLEGLSRECAPDGRTRIMGGQSFLFTASATASSGAREVLGENWRTVGVACKPSFISRELRGVDAELPDMLRRVEAGDPEAALWYAGDLSPEMSIVANSLLSPPVDVRLQPVYMRAKVVELVCLALDRLRFPEQDSAPALRLSRHDILCLQQAREILDASRHPPSLDDLARRVGLNRNKLALGFRHVIGKTVGDYHRELRLERARARLADPDCRIGQLAEEAGYRDAGSFSKAFRLRFGILPSEVPRPARSLPGMAYAGMRPDSRERE